MTPFAARFSFLVFALLTGAMAANIFVLQPPRELAGVARSSAKGEAATWSATSADTRSAPSSSSGGAVVPPLETSAVSPATEANRSDLTRAIQRELKAKGYEAGAVDGVAGLVTRGAIMAYEADSGLALTGEPRAPLLEHLVLGSPGLRTEDGARTPPGPEAEAVIRAVQRAFRQLGYLTTLPDGRLNEATRRAIRKFEQDRKLKESGRISGELLARLAGLANDALYAR